MREGEGPEVGLLRSALCILTSSSVKWVMILPTKVTVRCYVS